MSNETRTEHTWLDDLFLEDAAALFFKSATVSHPAEEEKQSSSEKFRPPTLAEAAPAAAQQMKSYWKTLRVFFRTGKGGGLPLETGRPSFFPAMVAPYLAGIHSGPYPCWIDDAKGGLESKPTTVSIKNLLAQKIAEFAPEENKAKALKDNLLRLHSIIQRNANAVAEPVQPNEFLNKALDELILQLNLKGTEGDAFLADVDQLRKKLPEKGSLLPLSNGIPFQMITSLMGHQSNAQSKALKNRITPLTARIHQLLDVEREKDPEAHSAAALEATMDFAGAFLKFEELASIMPSGGSVVMPEERLHRLEKVLQTLEQSETTFGEHKPTIVMAKSLAEQYQSDVKNLAQESNIEVVADDQVFEKIKTTYDNRSREFAEVFAALRIAQLEIEERYQHDVHGDLFAHFSATDFEAAEIALCPAFIMVANNENLVRSGLNEFSALLASSRPLKYLALKADALGHIEVHVLTGKQGQSFTSPLLWTSSAVSGREFPSFTFDNRKGPKWGSRFDISNNPSPDSDWPAEILLYTDADGSKKEKTVPFTFADFTALDNNFNHLYHVVPAEFWSDDLILLADYLQLNAADAYRKIPFIWVMNTQGQLQKAAVALPLVQTCLERLDFWHFLQENAGIHSYHVELATEKMQAEYEQKLEAAISAMKLTHQEEIEQTRDESARLAIENLADFLLDLDVTAVATVSADKTPKQPVAVAAPAFQDAEPLVEKTAENPVNQSQASEKRG
ncbi:MAG: hypothetical protein IPL65_21610 [Lewinellaceae bacterium]|nr:hypothetical protein [Lewinellaceae bacterium]